MYPKRQSAWIGDSDDKEMASMKQSKMKENRLRTTKPSMRKKAPGTSNRTRQAAQNATELPFWLTSPEFLWAYQIQSSNFWAHRGLPNDQSEIFDLEVCRVYLPVLLEKWCLNLKNEGTRVQLRSFWFFLWRCYVVGLSKEFESLPRGCVIADMLSLANTCRNIFLDTPGQPSSDGLVNLYALE